MSESLSSIRMAIAALTALGLLGPVCADANRPLLDPTRPSGWQAAEPDPSPTGTPSLDALRLQGTFSLAGERSAMISGQRVSVGDRVSGAEVMQIDRNKVTLRLDGETVELASLVPEVKSPANVKGDTR